MDEDQQFFEVLKSLKQDDLIDLIDDTVRTTGPEFIDKPEDVEAVDLDKLGEQIVQMYELGRGKLFRKGVVMNKANVWRRAKNEINILLWAMMILGLAGIGFMAYRRKGKPTFRFA